MFIGAPLAAVQIACLADQICSAPQLCCHRAPSWAHFVRPCPPSGVHAPCSPKGHHAGLLTTICSLLWSTATTFISPVQATARAKPCCRPSAAGSGTSRCGLLPPAPPVPRAHQSCCRPVVPPCAAVLLTAQSASRLSRRYHSTEIDLTGLQAAADVRLHAECGRGVGPQGVLTLMIPSC